jgi:hypothetical protein
MPGATFITIDGSPGKWAKNKGRVISTGPKCSKCHRGMHQHAGHPKDPKIRRGTPRKGPVMMAMVAHWDREWGEKGRSPGGPCGDVDGPLSRLLDSMAGPEGLVEDDAQVRVALLCTSYDKANPRIEVAVTSISEALLAMLKKETGLDFSGATRSMGQQEGLAL